MNTIEEYVRNFKASYPPSMVKDLAYLDIPDLLAKANDIKDHTGITTTANSIFDLLNRYSIFFIGFATTRAMYKYSQKDLRIEIETKVKQLGDELQTHLDKIKNENKEERKFLLARRDFWLTLGASLLVASIPVLITWVNSKNDSDILQDRLNKLENKVFQSETKLIIPPEEEK